MPASETTNGIWDCFHLNSVQKVVEDYVVSLRNTWTIYGLQSNGAVLWRLGGKRSNVAIPREARFSWQHDARLRADNDNCVLVSLFDDSCCQDTPPAGPSRGLLLRVHDGAAEIHATYYHAPALSSNSQGNVQLRPDGAQLVGWGAQSYMSEYRAAGNDTRDARRNCTYDARFPASNISYRTFSDAWVGAPHWPPSAVRVGRSVYASWNGSTETASWDVRDASGRVLARQPAQGFETRIRVAADAQASLMFALAADGRVLSRAPIRTPRCCE